MANQVGITKSFEARAAEGRNIDVSM